MNGDKRRVILYGDSLILAGVQASLSESPDLEVIALDPTTSGPVGDLLGFHPDAVIFDLGSVATEFPLVLLQQAGLLLIGIDPETHQTLVWSGRQAAAVAAADLIDVIRTDSIWNQEHKEI